MEAVKMQAITQFQSWPTSVYILLITFLVTFVTSLAWRPSLPKAAPKLMRGGYPILGMPRFFSDRRNFYNDGVQAAKSGNFSFYFGKYNIVGVSGVDGRKTFFDSKELNMAEGYAALFTTTPSIERTSDPGEAGSFSKWFTKNITAMMRKENFVKNLPRLVGDARARLEAIVARNSGGATGIFDPFDDIYRIVYHLTMRTVGANEIAESPDLLARTLTLFEQIEASNSPTRIIFPWLATPAHLRRMAAGERLYMIFKGIVDEREKNGRREDDALQLLLDSGDDLVKILAFTVGALFAGQLNSSINAAWLFVYLACNREWYTAVQKEVDDAVRLFRTSPSQTPADVLATLTLEDWESSFPLIDLCLRECIRLQAVGTAFRKNVSDRAVAIGGTGEEVAPGAFAIYLLDEVHFDPAVYPNPERWDPGRYMPGRAEDKSVPLAYLGWGTGRHPCLGMRFAKLEMGIIGALFVAMFDYELVDLQGNKMEEAPVTNRDNHSASKPDVAMRLRYTVRQY